MQIKPRRAFSALFHPEQTFPTLECIELFASNSLNGFAGSSGHDMPLARSLYSKASGQKKFGFRSFKSWAVSLDDAALSQQRAKQNPPFAAGSLLESATYAR